MNLTELVYGNTIIFPESLEETDFYEGSWGDLRGLDADSGSDTREASPSPEQG